MATALFSLGGVDLLIAGLILMVVAVIVAVAFENNAGAVSACIAGLALVVIIFGSISTGESIGEDNRALPDFSKRCRGGVELSVFKTDRRENDVEQVEDALDEIGCEHAVETVVQVPWGAFVEGSKLEPPSAELVPSAEEIRLENEAEINGGVTAPSEPNTKDQPGGFAPGIVP